MTEIPRFTAHTPQEWRMWLGKNHYKASKVLLIRYKKHTGKKTFSHREAMDEAICFGWIDTTVKRIDDERFAITFVKRNKNSSWSSNTLSYAEKLIKEKRMTKAGLRMYTLGKAKPTIDHGLPKNPDTPVALKKALAKNKKADAFFKTLAPSYRRYFIYWVAKAKRPETKQKRIKEIVEKCKKGEKQ